MGFKKVKAFKDFIIAVDSKDLTDWKVFTKEEWQYGNGLRYSEFDCGSFDECMENIDPTYRKLTDRLQAKALKI